MSDYERVLSLEVGNTAVLRSRHLKQSCYRHCSTGQYSLSARFASTFLLFHPISIPLSFDLQFGCRLEL